MMKEIVKPQKWECWICVSDCAVNVFRDTNIYNTNMILAINKTTTTKLIYP